MLNGYNFIGSTASAKGTESFEAYSTLLSTTLPGKFFKATQQEFEEAVALSNKAFLSYKDCPAEQKALFLDAIAEEIIAIGDTLIERAVAESGLPTGRITGERGRTCGQLQLFAKLLREGSWVDARIDTAQPDRQPAPKPDLRRMLIPIGPVAVFGASNFPLAFSTAGGDTASALAAGCPVIVKAHTAHPGTNQLVAAAIIKAATSTHMPEGVFSMLYLSHEQAIQLVQQPVIKAVGFTGSRSVGITLFNAAVQRPEPIPVYAEMSAINPVVLLPGALQQQGEKIAQGLATSVTMGVGQFCTNPGLVLAIDNESTQAFLTTFAAKIGATSGGSMLNKNIYKAYNNSISALQKDTAVAQLATAAITASPEKCEGQPYAFSVTADRFLNSKHLSDEVFGPATLVVRCKDETQLLHVLTTLEGQLTATLHAAPDDEQLAGEVLSTLTQKAGRVLYGGFPTGVEVNDSMVHGGPFPSTTDGKTTSVGTGAILRFVRPVAFQDFPEVFLPDALKNHNPLGIMRKINGELTRLAIDKFY